MSAIDGRSRAVAMIGTALGTLILVSGLSQEASGRNPIRQSLFNAYPEAVGSRLDDLSSIQGHCGVCHFDFTGGGPRNPYGAAVEAAIPHFPNNDTGRQQAIHSIENQDADGDGYDQVAEILDTHGYSNTPTFPGLTPGNVNQVSGVNLNDILAYLVPETGGDTQPPSVSVLAPDGGESWEGGTAHTISWSATDNIGVTAVDLYYRDSDAEVWVPIARAIENTGTWTWPVHNTPTGEARVRVVAFDAYGNQGDDVSDALFTIVLESGGIAPTSLRDFHQPGSQPFDAGGFQGSSECTSCHGGYDPTVEPGRNFRGSMMAQAGRDPLFYACLAIAEQDAPSSGDLCLRCHTSFGWLSGRSQPTGGGNLNVSDRDGVSCDLCHRMVDPVYTPGVDPAEDIEVLAGIDEVPAVYSNGQFVIDTQSRRRGPFGDAVAPHPFLESPFHTSSAFCGTCHDVSNPVFVKVGDGDYAPGPLDEEPESLASEDLMPLERTYSEWLNSAFPAGIYAPEFAGNKPDGMVSTCQDCHMRDVAGAGCNSPDAPHRENLPLHDMTGGSTWMPDLIASLYPDEVDPAALADGAARAEHMLGLAATVDLDVVSEADSFRVEATITNRSGHKLPTGYPEGRRMWLHLVARDAQGQTVYESGAYDPATGVLVEDAEIALYEAHLGISQDLSGLLGISAGKSFHFALNDSVYKDNRIPPAGFTNAAFATFGGAPVDPDHEGPGPRYADGQNWDAPSYPLPSSARTVAAALYYQSTSKEYVEFLRDENTSNGAGQLMYDLWVDHGRAAPVAVATDAFEITPSTAVDGPQPPEGLRVEATPNPFSGSVEVWWAARSATAASIEIFDLQGRLVMRREAPAAPGPQRFAWDGRGTDGSYVGSGIYWVRVHAGEESVITRVVRIR